MLHLCFPSAAALWKHHQCSLTGSACLYRSICLKQGDHTNWLALHCSGLCLFSSFPLQAVLVRRITSTPLIIPPYSSVARAIEVSPMPALLSFFHSPMLLWLCPFYGKCILVSLAILQDSARISPPKGLHQHLGSHCAMNLYHLSVPFLLTLHHLLLYILNQQE